MKPLAVLLLALCHALAVTTARAQSIDVHWNATPFEGEISLEPGQIAEACGKLSKGETVSWSFASSKALDFNIHYHQGKDAVYPMKRYKVLRLEGKLDAALDQTYCWMWSNARDAATTVAVRLEKKP